MAEVTEAPKKTEVTQGQGPEVKVARPAATLMPWTEPTFAFIHRFAEEMDRLFEDFGLGRPPADCRRSRPRAAAARGRTDPSRMVAADRRPASRRPVHRPRRPAGDDVRTTSRSRSPTR